MEYTVVVS